MFVRRFSALGLVCLCAVLVGAAPRPAPRATPSPAPSPTATPAPHRAAPLVVVFPFEASTDIKEGTGLSAAQVFVAQMNTEGGIDTILGPANVKRADYLKYATSVSASYYVSGYMTPLGNGVSLVEQVVSTRSGTILFGQTAQIESIQDATAQATMIHDGVVARERQLADAYTEAQARATSTPSSSNEADLGKGIKGLAGMFHHTKATPTPAPVVTKPAKGVLVAHVGGALPAADLTQGTSDLYASLGRRFNVRMTNAAAGTIAKSADALCGTDRNNTIATGTLSAQVQRHGFGSRTQYTFVLQMYTCFGAKLAEATGTSNSLAGAVDSAVVSYATEHADNL